MPPLIVSALLDPGTFGWLDDLRRAHFPPERNHLCAHLTLFHHLPGEHEDTIRARLEHATADRGPIPATVTGVRLLGRGVAYDVDAPELVALRRALAREWARWLTPQDAQWGRPHVTVQNKVEPAVARALHAELTASFTPGPASVAGLALWRYRDGPWEAAGEARFSGR